MLMNKRGMVLVYKQEQQFDFESVQIRFYARIYEWSYYLDLTPDFYVL